MLNRVVELVAPGALAERQHELPPLGPEYVRIEFRFCGICGSDYSRYLGRRGIAYPHSLGHEFVATVAAAGDAVSGFAAGDIVVSDLNFRCGDCDRCRSGRSHLCRCGQSGQFSNRGFASAADVLASYLVALDAEPQPWLALAEPLSCVMHALNWLALRDDDRVLVVGAGSLGLCAAFLLHSEQRAFEIAETVPTRAANVLAAAAPFAQRSVDDLDAYDAVIDLSGTREGLLRAVQCVQPGGRLCTMSHLDGAEQADFLLGLLARRDIAFCSSYLNGEQTTLRRAAALLIDRWSDTWQTAVEVVQAPQLAASLAAHATKPHNKTIVDLADLHLPPP